jgi:hypothetical protein
MSKQIFIHLPVADAQRSRAFFEKVGFTNNPQFTGDTSACVVVSETIYVLLSEHAQFMQFSPKSICDTSKALEVLLCLNCDSRVEVDDMAAKAVEAGATDIETSDFGFMYQRSFLDLDGHAWALNFMNDAPPQN